MTNSFKTLAAAAIVAVAGSAAFAGPNYIIPGNQASSKTTANVELVRADAPATLEVYSVHGGERVALLGSTDVKAGANTDVKVSLSTAPRSNIEFVLVGSNGADLANTNVNNIQ